MRIAIKNGRVIDPATGLDSKADLFIENGKIAAIGKAPAGFKAEQTIDAINKLVCPGLIDLSARLREPGQEYKASIATETRAAASGGITTLCCPPDTTPVIDTPAVVELIHQRTMAAGKSRVYCLGALTRDLNSETLATMHKLKEAGCIAVSNGFAAIKDSAVLKRAMEYAATCNLPVHLYCEDEYLRDDGVVHEGMMSVRLGLPGISPMAEAIAVSRALLLAEQTGARVHFCRLSSARSVELIADARKRKLPISADVAITHLFLSEIDLAGFNSMCHLRPPLRTTEDRSALRAGIAEGIIDAVCSDHQPHNDDAKSAPFGQTEPGASTLDVLLSLVLQLVRDGSLNIKTALAALTLQPARILHIDAGTLAIGTAADICIIDPEQHWTVTPETLNSAGKNCPFMGWEMTGRVTHTLLDGKLIYSID